MNNIDKKIEEILSYIQETHMQACPKENIAECEACQDTVRNVVLDIQKETAREMYVDGMELLEKYPDKYENHTFRGGFGLCQSFFKEHYKQLVSEEYDA